jgi:hypothetical protein
VTQFITGGRGSGKTHAAVQWLLEKPEERVILTTGKQRVHEICAKYGLTGRQVISAQGHLKVPYALRGRDVEVAIDDLDDFLQRVFQPFHVMLVTATGEGTHQGVVSNEAAWRSHQITISVPEEWPPESVQNLQSALSRVTSGDKVIIQSGRVYEVDES